jgi:hypothetical protein
MRRLNLVALQEAAFHEIRRQLALSCRQISF